MPSSTLDLLDPMLAGDLADNDLIYVKDVSLAGLASDKKMEYSELRTKIKSYTDTLYALIGSSSSINPKDFGAIGDGASHLLTAPDVAAHPEWLGAYVIGTDELDYIGIQEAIYAAFGGPGIPHSYANSRLNKTVKIPNGKYFINKTIWMTNVYGYIISGEGKGSTLLSGTGVNQPILYMDGVSYGLMHDIAFETQVANSNALVELDRQPATASLSPQQISFRDIVFSGNNVGDLGLRFAKSGSAAQSDTIIVDNCFALGFKIAAYGTGEISNVYPFTPVTLAYNALSIIFLSGDIQGCPQYGIYCLGGSFMVDGLSTQNQDINQIRNNGFDFYQYGNVGAATVLRDVRSESAKLASGISNIENCIVEGGSVAARLMSQPLNVGMMIASSNVATANGRTYMVTQSGMTDAAIEPDWAAMDADFWGRAQDNCSMVAGTPTVTTTVAGSWNALMIGKRFIMTGAGVGGADLIATVIAVPDVFTLTLDTNASTNVSNRDGRWGTEYTDGTVKFMPYDYDAVVDVREMVNTAINYGVVSTSNRVCIRNCMFSRTDWQYASGASQIDPFSNGVGTVDENVFQYVNVVVGVGGTIHTTAYAPYRAWRNSGTFNAVPLARATDYRSGGPIIWMGGGGNKAFYGVGIGRRDGNETDKVKNNVGVYGGLSFDTITFAELALGTRDGVVWYVTDGTVGSSPLVGGGTGTLAVRNNGVWQAISGYTAPVVGADTQVIFNDAGALAGDTGLTYSKALPTLSVVGNLGSGYFFRNAQSFGNGRLGFVLQGGITGVDHEGFSFLELFTGATRLFCDALGQIGIGTTAPNTGGGTGAVKLAVNGNILAQGNIGWGTAVTSALDTGLARNAAGVVEINNGTAGTLRDLKARNIDTTGYIKSSGTTGIGYATGAGGTVTQLTNKATGVTLNKITGQITLNAAALAAGAIVTFTLTNSTIVAGDVLLLQHTSGGTPGPYLLNAQSAAGSATINVRNTSAGSLSEAIVISFAVIKAVTA